MSCEDRGSRISLGDKKYYCASYDFSRNSPSIKLFATISISVSCISSWMVQEVFEKRLPRRSASQQVLFVSSHKDHHEPRSRNLLSPLTYIPATSIELYIHLRCLRLRALDFIASTEDTLLLCTSFRVFTAAPRAIERWR
jgi:hypothetical protein